MVRMDGARPVAGKGVGWFARTRGAATDQAGRDDATHAAQHLCLEGFDAIHHLRISAEGLAHRCRRLCEFADPREAASRYATSTGDFDVGFERPVVTLSGVDPNRAPLGPPTQEVFRWPDAGSPAAS
jgi:hypothetical protein